MAASPRRVSGIFPGLVLLAAGILLLLHNYGGLDLSRVFWRWWPLVLIFLGAIKIYERAVASRTHDPGAARISGSEILLVLGLMALLSLVIGVDYFKGNVSDKFREIDIGDAYPFGLDVTPVHVPPNARITVHALRGNITVRPADTSDIRVTGSKQVHAWNENDAQRRAGPVSVEIVPNGDGYEIHSTNASDSHVSVDMDIQVPLKASVAIRNEKGDILISDMSTPVSVTNGNGDVEVRNTASDVSVEMHKGDVKVSDTKGDVKISGKGGEVNIASATGSFTLDGEFYGPIRADKIAKGLRFVSQRTDLTLTQLTGHMEASSGNLEVVDAPGDLTLRTNRYSVTVENATGKVRIANRGGDVDLRFSSPPKEDIEVDNSNANISLTFPESASFNIQADCHSCDVDSEFSSDTLKKTSNDSGDNHLEGHYGPSSRGSKITLKTSYGSIGIHKTS
jgi:hypothetical protein